MTDLNSIIEINISRETTPVARASFSIPCFISAHTRFSERARVYTSLDGVAEDFASTSTAYVAAQKLFGQEISPEQVVLGRRQVDEIDGSIATVANSTVYSVTINDELVATTSDSSATAIKICAALKTAFTAASVDGVTFTDNLDGTFTVANSVAGTALTIKSTANVTRPTLLRQRLGLIALLLYATPMTTGMASPLKAMWMLMCKPLLVTLRHRRRFMALLPLIQPPREVELQT